MIFAPDELRFRLDSLAAARPAYTAVLRFLEEVRGAQDAADAPSVPAAPPSPGEARASLDGGFPIVDGGRLDLAVPAVTETAGRILALLAEREGEGGEDLSGYAFLGVTGDADALRVYRMAALHDVAGLEAMATGRGLNPGILTFVARASVKPYFWALRDGLASILPAEWDHGTCPCCGNPPAMERLEGEGGKRFLGCSLCEYDWRYPRMRCPICGTEDQQALRRFTDESGGEASVFLCDACRHYVKSVDGRLLPEGERVIIPVEDVVTLHLDIVARRLGYLPPSVGSFAFPVGADQA